jgi:integrase
MPLKLIPPRAGKSPNWTIRGTHHGVAVDKTSGASNRADAARILAKVKSEIDAGAFAVKGERTFADAAEQYVIATNNMRFIMPVAEHFGYKPLSQIDARAVDEAATALYPNASPATRNRQVYTVVSAILRHAGVTIAVKRPKGSAGARRVAYLEPKQAFALIKAATAHDARFGALLTFLLYTGARLNEALSLTWADVDLLEARALIYQTKTEGARTAFLPDQVVAALGPLHAAEKARGAKPAKVGKNPRRVFGLTKCGRIYTWLQAAADAAGVPIPDRVAFHLFRHTWATWMRRYGGMDTAGLVETGAWKSRVSASVYEHLDATVEGRKAALLPFDGQ